MRSRASLSGWMVAGLCCAGLMGCKAQDRTVGLVPAKDRLAPLSPATRSQLEAAGASCTPNPSGPVLCTWSGGRATCTLTFDAQDSLTHLECAVDGLVYECTRPGQLYVCSWSDDPGCADVYGLDGTFEAYLCGQALQDRIARGQAGDASYPDASPADAADEDGGIVTRPDAGGDCSGLDEASCTATFGCHPFYCPTCTGQNFVFCGRPNDPPPPCAPPLCNCENLGEADCNADPTCHAVYQPHDNCGCAPLGCCTTFDRCVEGPADCTGLDLSCRAVEPSCEGPYVVGYQGTCYEGCVLASACPPSPVNCSVNPPVFPTFSDACQTTQDCFAAIHQIDCCGTDHALGLNLAEMGRFGRAEAICQPQYPACGCADRGIMLDDGNVAFDAAHVGAACMNMTPPPSGGVCRTFLVP